MRQRENAEELKDCLLLKLIFKSKPELRKKSSLRLRENIPFSLERLFALS